MEQQHRIGLYLGARLHTMTKIRGTLSKTAHGSSVDQEAARSVRLILNAAR